MHPPQRKLLSASPYSLNQSGFSFLSALAILFIISVAFAGISAFLHFGDCKDTELDLLVVCQSLLPASTTESSQEPPAFGETKPATIENAVITRVSDNVHFGLSNGQATHNYSRRQAWNIDESLLDIGGKIVDANSLEIVINESYFSSEHVWSNKNPNLIYGLRFHEDKLNQFGRFSVDTKQFEVIHTFGGEDQCSIGSGEGSISNDDRYVVISCGAKPNAQTLYTLDIVNAKPLAKKRLNLYVNWAGISQSGRFVVIEASDKADTSKFLNRYSRNLSDEILLTDKRHHGDFGIDDTGEDVFAMIGPHYISYVRLSDAEIVRSPISGYLKPAGHGHISCRNILRPGWCYFSSYRNIVGAVRISKSKSMLTLGVPSISGSRGAAVFEHWGAHESSSADYASQPKLSVSPSGTQIIFTSDWHGSEDINDYVISVQHN